MLNTVWEIPDPLAVREVRLDKDTVIALRRHGNPNGSRLVLGHGSGLAIDLYYPFWSLLTDEFDLILYDLRNHGWNTVGPRARHNIPTLIHDHEHILEEIDRHFGDKPKVGVYHSVSALIALLSSATTQIRAIDDRRPLAAQVLLDPTLCKPGTSQLEFEVAATRAAEAIRRRGYRFQSRDAFVELLSFFPAFARVVPGVRELMARTTLRRSSNGQDYELRCPREYEAQIMQYTRIYCVLVDLGQLACPTKVIGSDPTLPYAYLPTLDLADMADVDYDFLPETTHLFPLEKPAECAALIRDFLQSNGLP
ncbi:MAG: alpha/beta hydrolase [Spirochaetaceae bacterium]|nr:alpha/beta hydrolase [Spirochaetaceae bacterium]MDE0227638.1 alpha/beta hydrolase [Spirochaetaceae bacterium]